MNRPALAPAHGSPLNQETLLTSRRNFLRACTAAGAGTALGASAQDKRPISIVVGFAPGGSPDFVARTLAEKVSARLGRPVVVENRAGAGGQLALAALQNARADGTTYALTPPGMITTYPALYPKLPYDVAQLEPVAGACTFDFSIAASAAVPVKTLAEFLAWAKANPKQASYGIPAAGTSPHFVGMLLARASGVDLQALPYRGGPPMVADLLGGQIPLAINVSSNFTEHHRSGKAKVLATTGVKRNPLMQEVPTMAELGYKEAQLEEWYAFFTKTGTPAGESAAFATAVREALKMRDVAAALLASGHTPEFTAADALAVDLRRTTERWSTLIKQTGFRLES